MSAPDAATRRPGRHRRAPARLPRAAVPLLLVAGAAALVTTLRVGDVVVLRAALLGVVALVLALAADRARLTRQVQQVALAETTARRAEVAAVRSESAALAAQVQSLEAARRAMADELAGLRELVGEQRALAAGQREALAASSAAAVIDLSDRERGATVAGAA